MKEQKTKTTKSVKHGGCTWYPTPKKQKCAPPFPVDLATSNRNGQAAPSTTISEEVSNDNLQPDVLIKKDDLSSYNWVPGLYNL